MWHSHAATVPASDPHRRFAAVFVMVLVFYVIFIQWGNFSYRDDAMKPARTQLGLTAKVDERKHLTDVMKFRAKRYHERCEKVMPEKGQGRIDSDSLRRIVVNDEYKLLYCPIPKIACTNLLRVFLILSGNLTETDPLKLPPDLVHTDYLTYLKRLNQYSDEQTEYRIRNYKKIIFVREPFERLLSAYKNKFLQPGNIKFKINYGKKIIQKFRANASNESLKRGGDVTFKEFVQYLLQRVAAIHPLDAHWNSYTNLCDPCGIRYDYIGKYETIYNDVDFLLKTIGVSDTIRFPQRNDSYKTTKTKDVMYEFYRDIDSGSINKIKQILATDFKLFDYKVPDEIMKILEREQNN